jgi:beta-lactamase regulating signal transducer with metallopeptidase domain
MNTHLFASVENMWILAGWTMIHFLWLGTLVALAALISRWLLRRTSANVRYAVALTCLAILAAMPMAIAMWLHQYSPSAQVADQPLRNDPASRVIELKDIEPTPLATPPTIAKGDIPISVQSAQQPAPPSNITIAVPTPAIAAPSTTDPLSLAVSAINRSVQYLPWLWLIGTPLTFTFTATGLIGTRRLRRASRPITDGPIAETLAHLADSLRLTCRVVVAVCDRIAAPVLIGILRPIILLPPAALTGYSPEEIEMVLLHELAHVRRWDNLVNLLQRVVESLLFFHPAVWLISSWARREREACCDALVVARTDHPHAYAELLVALAAQMPRSVLFHPAASSAMAAGPLHSRIRRILQLDDDPMLISGKSFAIVLASLFAVATVVGLYLPTNGHAEPSESKLRESTDLNHDENQSARGDEPAASIAAKFPHEVQFEKGAAKFLEGDAISIDEVRGTAKTFEPGNQYWIKGTYKLHSHDRAQISAFTTARDAADGTGPIQSIQTKQVSGGDKAFTLILPMSCRGWPHISFYPADNGGDFGGIYFGTGDSVLKEWWGSENSKSAADDFEIRKQQVNAVNNLKNLGIALLNYDSAHQHFPANAIYSLDGKPLLSWRVALLPFIDPKLYGEFHLDEPWNSEHNSQLIASMPDTFKDPKVNKEGMTNYLAVVGKECVFDGSPKGLSIKNVTDGTSNTIAVVEANTDLATEWTRPQDWNFDREQPTRGLGQLWPRGWYGAWVDGSVSRVENNKPADQAGIQFTRAGGETKSLQESANHTATEGIVAQLLPLFQLKEGERAGEKIYQLPAALGKVFPELPELIEQLKKAAPQSRFTYNLKDSGRTLEVIAPAAAHAQFFEPRIAHWEKSAKVDDWPAGVAFPSPKEGEISTGAWREWRIKVVPCTQAEQREAGGDSTLKVVGTSVPITKSPMFLSSINGVNTRNFAELAVALSVLKGQKVVVATCYRNTPQGLISTDIALDGTDKPAIEDSRDQSLTSTPASGAKGSSKFPSLEDQKLADLVWKRLTLEMEPIGQVDLKRVKAFGYDGGMRLADIRYANKDSVVQGQFTDDDILVGLHVWPTRNMKDVAEVLNRPDLADLTPLKFYVVGREQHSTIADSQEQVQEDVVRTGRISVNLGDNSASLGTTYQSAPPVASDPNKPNLQSAKSPNDPKVAYLAAQVEQASLFKMQALDKRQQAQSDQEIEAAKRGLERADRQLEDAKRQLENSKRVAEENSQNASRKLEAAMKAKQDALIKRQQAKGQEAIEAAKQELEKANRQLEDVKRSLEKEIHSAETGNSNAQPTLDIKPRPSVAIESSSGSTSESASPEELEILRDRIKIAEMQSKYLDEQLKSGGKAYSKDRFEIAAYELALAEANLATAEGKHDEALAKLIVARAHEEEAYKAVVALYDIGRVSYDLLRNEANRLAEIKLKVARLKGEKSSTRSAPSPYAGSSNSAEKPEPHQPLIAAASVPLGTTVATGVPTSNFKGSSLDAASNPYTVQPHPSVVAPSSAPTLSASFPATPSMTPDQPAPVPAPKPERSLMQTQLEQMEKLVEVGANSAADRDKWIQQRRAAAEQMMEAASAGANVAAKAKEDALARRKDAKDDKVIEAAKRQLEVADRQFEEAHREFESAARQLAELKQFVDSRRQDEQKSPSTQVERPIKVGNTNSWSVIVNDSADGKDSSHIQKTPAEPEKKVALPSAVVVPNVEQVKVAELHNVPLSTKDAQAATKPVPPTPVKDPKQTKQPGNDSVIVAHEIPEDLEKDVRQYVDRLRDQNVRTSWDDRGRLIMQASQVRQDELEKLLKFTSEWRQSIAKKGAAGRVVFSVRKVDGEDVLDLPAAGLSFVNDAHPNHRTPTGPGGVCVQEVAPGSPAAWIDVRPGDILNRLGAFQATDVSELASIIKTLQEGTAADRKLELTFFRSKSEGSNPWVGGPLPLVAETDAAELLRERRSWRSEKDKRQSTSDKATGLPKQVAEPKASAQPGPGPNDKPIRLYDGRTFESWRSTWRNELSTEKRIEAVKALAAFAANGYDQEATQAILDVAGDYDWEIIDNDGEGKLLQTILDVLNPSSGRRSKTQNGLSELMSRFEKDPKKWRPLAEHFFYGLRSVDEPAMAKLRSLAETGPAEIRPMALAALVRIDQERNRGTLDDKTSALLSRSLQTKDVPTLQSTLQLLLYYPQSGGGGMTAKPQARIVPEFIPLLFHADESVRKQAREILESIDDESAKPVIKETLTVLKDKSRRRDHIEAVRALAAMSESAKDALKKSEAMKELVQLCEQSDDKDLAIAAFVGLARTRGVKGVEEGGEQSPQRNALLAELLAGSSSNTIRAIAEKLNYYSDDFKARYEQANDQIVRPRTDRGGAGFF